MVKGWGQESFRVTRRPWSRSYRIVTRQALNALVPFLHPRSEGEGLCLGIMPAKAIVGIVPISVRANELGTALDGLTRAGQCAISICPCGRQLR